MGITKRKIVYIVFLIYSLFSPLFSQTLNDAIAEIEKKDYKKSIAILKELTTKEPEYSTAYLYLGYSYMMDMNYKSALASYQKADEISSSIESLSGIHWVYWAMEDYDNSIRTGEKILKLDENNYYATYRKADAHLGKKEYAIAKEHYQKNVSLYGKSADLLWKIGLCEYYMGNQEEAVQLFKEGAAIDPNHKGLQYSLNYKEGGAEKDTSKYPIITVAPEATTYSFHGSEYVGHGAKGGLKVYITPNEKRTYRLGGSTDVAQNVNRNEGVTNYILDNYNMIQYKNLGNTSYIVPYLLYPTNLYNLYNINTAKDYVMNKFSYGVTHYYSDKLHFSLSPQYLQSNVANMNAAKVFQAGVSYGFIGLNVARISYPKHSGGQVSLSITIPLLNHFYSTTNFTGQRFSMEHTTYYPLSLYPVVYTIPIEESYRRYYGFVQQEFSFYVSNWSLGIGGRLGDARTPTIGENWIYTNFDLKSGGYIFATYIKSSFSISIQYSHDNWYDSLNKTPVSDQGKIILTWRI